MSGYPHNPPGYGYGPTPTRSYSAYGPSAPPPSQPPYGATSAPYATPSSPYGATSAPYGATSAPSAPYATKPQKENKPSGSQPSAPGYGAPQPYGAPPTAQPYGAPLLASQPYGASQPYSAAQPYGGAAQPYGGAAQPYGAALAGYGGGPFAGLVPSVFPPGTDPSIVACFQIADKDGSGMIDDYELQRALSSYNQSFSIRTVHLLIFTFTNSNTRKIGPKEFTALYYSLQNWRSIFERFDRDRSGKIDVGELREALLSLGFSVSQVILDLLVSKFDKTGGKSRAIEYDNFIECCLTVKGLTEKFKEKDIAYSGSATFTYESFMLTVLPFLIA